MLDLTIFEDPSKKFCVRCRDEESSFSFLGAMKDQHPQRCTRWNRIENHFDNSVGYIDYYPYINGLDGAELLWDDEDFAEKNGYTIVEFYDIPGARPIDDLGEIDSCDFDINNLF